MRAASTGRRRLITGALLAAVAALFALALAAGGGSAEYTGSDTRATEEVERSHPGYRPWARSLFVPPSGEVESGLFAAQAALGAGVLGYVLGLLRGRASAGARQAGTGFQDRPVGEALESRADRSTPAGTPGEAAP